MQKSIVLHSCIYVYVKIHMKSYKTYNLLYETVYIEQNYFIFLTMGIVWIL